MDKYFKITLCLSFFAHLAVLTMVYVPDLPMPTNIIDLEVTFGHGVSSISNSEIVPKQGDKGKVSTMARQALPLIPPLTLTAEGEVPSVSKEKLDNNVSASVVKKNNPEASTKVSKAQLRKETFATEQRLNALSPAADSGMTTPYVPLQYPQEETTAKLPGQSESAGHILGNVQKGKDVGVLRYEMKVSLWLDKFRKYPKAAIDQGLEGEGTLFIKIDRQGNILQAKIKRSTGYIMLDNALIKMAKDANPIIAPPPSYYPKKNNFSYEITFRFSQAEWEQEIQEDYN